MDKIQIVDETYLNQDLFDKKVFASNPLWVSNLQIIPEKTVLPIQLHKIKDVKEKNSLYSLDIKKRTYQEKKILLLNPKDNNDLEYANAMDYCHMSLYDNN
jgi:hypothetical protein